MEKISRSVRQAKQGKNLMMTVPVRTVRIGHVVGLYRTHVICVANGMRTRGPTRGCHVSLLGWFMIVVCKNYWESTRFDPRTSPTM
jgi:hypothetical protein